MGTSFAKCKLHLDRAVNEVFEADPKIQSLGIARHEDAFGFKAIRNSAAIVPTSGDGKAHRVPRTVKSVPVIVETVTSDIVPQAMVPFPFAASFVSEQQNYRPLVCGLQIQNFDDDSRQRKSGKLGAGKVTIGTLGGFVQLSDGDVGMLSNNHVMAGVNRGIKDKDRILQRGALTFAAAEHAATLTDFVPLLSSPGGALPAAGNVVFNTVDAAIARLEDGVKFQQSYLPGRGVPRPGGLATAQVGDKVFKVGQATGLTFGTVTAVSAVVGPIEFAAGECWFSQQIEIAGDSGTLFANHGDSGALIVLTSGEVVGLLFAGNGTQTYACPIQNVEAALNCSLA